MKLGALNSAIRAAAVVKINVNLGGQAPVEVAVQKGSLIEGLADTFTEGRAQETGLFIRADGFIMRESEK